MDKNEYNDPFKIGEAFAGQESFEAWGNSPEDLAWLDHLASLPPKDLRGAFVLTSELPNRRSSPRDVLDALVLAARRAFGPEKRLEFTDYEQGRLWGTMHVLLPQGREEKVHFNGEPGWKAVGILGEGYEARPVITYYRERCMNPLRVISRTEAVVDTSDVTFIPLQRDAPELVVVNPALDELIASSTRRLAAQYQSIREQRPGGLLERLFRMIFGGVG